MFISKIVEFNDSLNKLYVELLKVFNELNILNYKNYIGIHSLSPLFVFNFRFLLSSLITDIKNESFPSL